MNLNNALASTCVRPSLYKFIFQKEQPFGNTSQDMWFVYLNRPKPYDLHKKQTCYPSNV